jgi:hypothetical protein
MILSLADGASSVTAAFTPEQAAVVADTVGVDVLVSLKEWRKRA